MIASQDKLDFFNEVQILFKCYKAFYVTQGQMSWSSSTRTIQYALYILNVPQSLLSSQLSVFLLQMWCVVLRANT